MIMQIKLKLADNGYFGPWLYTSLSKRYFGPWLYTSLSQRSL